MVRIICISDTHSLHEGMLYNLDKLIDPNKKNILLHAGDCTNVGREFETKDFVKWFERLEGFDLKLFIAGNHDFSFEKEPDYLYELINEEKLLKSNVVYLEDETYVLSLPEFERPIRIYGSPWQPEFRNWAFNLPRNGNVLNEKWNNIPPNTDILITHGPSYGILDRTPTNEYVGCQLLRNKVNEIRPLIHVSGHIHDSRGVEMFGDTLCVNASICTERYLAINKPIIIDLSFVYGDLIIDKIEE